MFNNLFEQIMNVREVRAPAKSMPDEQIAMLDTFKKNIDDMPRKFTSQKFWLMNDGRLITVGWEHSDTSDWAGVNVKDLLGTGAIRGEVGDPWSDKSYLAVEYWNETPTDDQIDRLKEISSSYKVKEFILDDTYGGLRSSTHNVKSADQVEYIIRHGSLDEATLGDIHRKQRSVKMLFPTFDDRVKNVQLMGGVRLKEMDDDNWHFKVHSGTKKDVWYDCTLHFKDIQDQLEKFVKDRRLWVDDKSRVDLRKLAAAFIDGVNVQVFCSCPAFLYYGSSYILGRPQYDAKYTDPENRPPRKRNPKQYGAVCKHYHNVMKALPFYTTTIAKWLRDFYARDIAGYQREAMREFGRFRGAAVKLAKRKAGVDRKRREKPEEQDKQDQQPPDQTQPENVGNTSEDIPENESKVQEAVEKKLPPPQARILGKYGSWDLEFDEDCYWLLNNGAAVAVLSFEQSAGEVKTTVNILRKYGALTVFVDRGSDRVSIVGYRKPTSDQRDWLKSLIKVNHIESVEVDNCSTLDGEEFRSMDSAELLDMIDNFFENGSTSGKKED